MENKDKKLKKIIINQPLKLDCGKTINNFPLAYETYGTLNKSKNNVWPCEMQILHTEY